MSLYFKRYLLSLIGLLAGYGILFSGCSATEPSAPKVIDTIIIKNSTGEYIQKVSISEVTADAEERQGSISPVPVGIEQVFGRGSRAKRLPDTLKVHWVDSSKRAYEKSISISSLLDATPSHTQATIILEFAPDGVINVFKK
jgi:hypothetical protein